MLEVLHFIFSSFWVWFGTLILITAFGGALGRIFAGIRGKLHYEIKSDE